MAQGQIYATLIPSSVKTFEFGAARSTIASGRLQTERVDLANGQASYLVADPNTVSVSHKFLPAGQTFGGEPWQSLQTITIPEGSAGTVRIEVSGTAAYSADALRLSKATLPNLSVVDLRDNPLDDRALDAVIPALQSTRTFLQPTLQQFAPVVDVSSTKALIEGINFSTNDVPQATRNIEPQSLAAGTSKDVDLSGLITDGQPLKFTAFSDTNEISVAIVGNTLRIASQSGFTGTGIVTLIGSDASTVEPQLAGRKVTFQIPVSVGLVNYTGIVFDDVNANGVQDVGEAGLETRLVYVDKNANGAWNQGEPRVVTDYFGQYTLVGITPSDRSLITLDLPRSGPGPTGAPISAITSSLSANWLNAPGWSAQLGENLYFAVQGSDGSGIELWKFDGTSNTQLTDINPSGDSLALYEDPVVVNGSIYFVATPNTTDYFIYGYNGTTLTQVSTSPLGNVPSLVAYNNEVVALVYDNVTFTNRLMKLQSGGFVPLFDAAANDINNLFGPVASNGSLYFSGYNSSFVYRFYRFDGTNVTAIADSYANDAIDFQGVLMFTQYQAATGTELYRYDGTGAPVLIDILPGLPSSNPADLIVSNNTLLLTAYNGTQEVLYSYDGVSVTPVPASIDPLSTGNLYDPVDSPEGLYFYTYNYDTGATSLYLYHNKPSAFSSTLGGITLIKDLSSAESSGIGDVQGGKFRLLTADGVQTILPKPAGTFIANDPVGAPPAAMNFDQVSYVNAGQPQLVNEGKSIRFLGNVTRPNSTSPSVRYFWEVRQGGVLRQQSPTFNLPSTTPTLVTAFSFTPADNGLYQVTLVMLDGETRYEHSTQASVAATPPFLNLPATYRVVEGRSFVQNVSFVDAGADAWRATVDYGDGSPLETLTITGATRTLRLDHVYPDNGTYNLTVKLLDTEDRLEDIKVAQVTVVAQTTITATSEVVLAEGSLLTRTMTFNDGSDAWVIEVDYGDGTPVETLTSTSVGPILISAW